MPNTLDSALSGPRYKNCPGFGTFQDGLVSNIAMLPQPSIPFEKELLLGAVESDETLIRHHFNDDEENTAFRVKSAFKFQWFHATHGLLFILCAFFFASWIRNRGQCVEIPYSPANAAIEYHNEFTIFNGSFKFPSIYRGDPTPELDEAWNRISTDVSLVRLTREELLKSGKKDTPSKVRFSEADGGGYIAFLEVAHELHCLNVLRKYLYFEHYGKVDTFFTETDPKNYRIHLEHCIENLRQSIMCTANTGMITYEWVSGFSSQYPDFNTRHTCRDFEKIIAWQNGRGVHNIPQSHMMRLEGQVDLEQGP